MFWDVLSFQKVNIQMGTNVPSFIPKKLFLILVWVFQAFHETPVSSRIHFLLHLQRNMVYNTTFFHSWRKKIEELQTAEATISQNYRAGSDLYRLEVITGGL